MIAGNVPSNWCISSAHKGSGLLYLDIRINPKYMDDASECKPFWNGGSENVLNAALSTAAAVLEGGGRGWGLGVWDGRMRCRCESCVPNRCSSSSIGSWHVTLGM